MDLLKPQVLEERDRPSGTLVISALRGQGGIGKSTLAAALALEPEVRSRFPDGVLWATLGQQPDLLSLLSGWVQALGNDSDRSPVQATTIPAATAQLRTLLHDRTALLVVDDVWNADDARPFLAGGPRCRVVITTRRADIADEVGARRFELDVMTREQSLALLSSRLDSALEGDEREQAARLARAVGYLPLALELAAARVLRGVDWDDLRGAFEQEVARLEALEGARRPSRSQTRLEASFNLSLDALRADDEAAWRAFAWLGVLPEDVTISAPMAATLWDKDEAEAAELLELLWNDALLLAGPAVLVEQRSWPGYRLHDLLYDMARRLLIAPEPQGLGLSLPQAHEQLLERYRARCQRKDVSGSYWHQLADDGYIHGRLVWHMAEAGQFEWIVALLGEETAEGRNGWFMARERLGQTAGFLEDVARAWELAQVRAEQCIKQGKAVEVLGLEVRFALMLTSINSMAANIPGGLLKALLTCGIWSPEQAVAYAWQTPKGNLRLEALSSVAEHLSESQQQQALEEALAAARDIGYSYFGARALAQIAEHLPEPQRQQAIEEASAVAPINMLLPVRARADIAEHLFEPVLNELLTAARNSGDESYRARELVHVAEHLMEPQKQQVLEEALAVAHGIGYNSDRAQALADIAEHLPDLQKRQVLEEALVVAQSIGDKSDRSWTLANIAGHLARLGQSDQALVMARAIGDEIPRALALQHISKYLSQPDKQQALNEAMAAARGIGDESCRANALASIMKDLSEAQAATEKSPQTSALVDTAEQFRLLLYEAALWRENLHSLAVRSRADLLRDGLAYHNMTVIAVLGGVGALTETAQAIEDVGRWWP